MVCESSTDAAAVTVHGLSDADGFEDHRNDRRLAACSVSPLKILVWKPASPIAIPYSPSGRDGASSRRFPAATWARQIAAAGTATVTIGNTRRFTMLLDRPSVLTIRHAGAIAFKLYIFFLPYIGRDGQGSCTWQGRLKPAGRFIGVLLQQQCALSNSYPVDLVKM
jgi:hypothetical protein